MDVKHCLESGEIIEHYPDDYPLPSCLVFGRNLTDTILHVVVGTDGNNLFIITAYFPTESKFGEDLKTRRN